MSWFRRPPGWPAVLVDGPVVLRPYRRSLGAAEAASELRRCAGTQFDPEVVEAFLAALDAGEILPGEAAVAA